MERADRYWEARWRDERKEIVRFEAIILALRTEAKQLEVALQDLVDRWSTERGFDGGIQRARELLIDRALRLTSTEEVRAALEQQK